MEKNLITSLSQVILCISVDLQGYGLCGWHAKVGISAFI